jgi:hypothetical protein
MDSLEYSIDALDAKGLFYNKCLTVFVEGKDDVLFWDYLFKIAEVSAHIEDVGGDKEIEKYIVDILDNDASFLVACDNDHNDFIETKINHPQIIRTYGYSIENSMYNFDKIEDIISKLSRQRVGVKNVIEKWAEDFSNQVYELLKYDIANHKYKKGVAVFGDSCVRFLKSNSSHKLSKEKINQYIGSIKDKFEDFEIQEVERLLNTSEKEFWYLIKGHFLTNATMNLIKSLVNEQCGANCGISLDMIYSLTIDCTENWDNRIDILTVVNEIRKLNKIA